MPTSWCTSLPASKIQKVTDYAAVFDKEGVVQSAVFSGSNVTSVQVLIISQSQTSVMTTVRLWEIVLLVWQEIAYLQGPTDMTTECHLRMMREREVGGKGVDLPLNGVKQILCDH